MRVQNAEVLSAVPVRGGEGQNAYAYDRVSILDRESAQVIEARVSDQYGITPREGDVIDAVIAVNLYTPRQGAPRLTFQLVRPCSPARPSAVPAPAKTGTNG